MVSGGSREGRREEYLSLAAPLPKVTVVWKMSKDNCQVFCWNPNPVGHTRLPMARSPNIGVVLMLPVAGTIEIVIAWCCNGRVNTTNVVSIDDS